MLLSSVVSTRLGQPQIQSEETVAHGPLLHRKLRLLQQHDDSKVLPDQYIVLLDPDRIGDTRRGGLGRIIRTLLQHVLQQRQSQPWRRQNDDHETPVLLHTYEAALTGFCVSHLQGDDLVALLDSDDVLMVVQDGTVQLAETENDSTSESDTVQTETEIIPWISQEASRTWALDRIDQSALPLDRAYHYHAGLAGASVKVYILDTGIRETHTQFQNANGRTRVSCAFNALHEREPCDDWNGHGTHVAGLVGGVDYGVAKQVSLVNVKVMGAAGGGTWSNILAGLNYVVTQQLLDPATRRIANISIAGGLHEAMNVAVQHAVRAGVTVVAAAGNDNVDACTQSPAAAEGALAVAATTARDNKASFSNHGPCVSLFAPGSGLVSAGHDSDVATRSKSGTSMASPIVAGVAALYLDAHSDWGPVQVKQALQQNAIRNAVSHAGQTPNLLVSTRGISNGQETFPPTEPQCLRLLSSCQDASECCLHKCRLGMCFLL